MISDLLENISESSLIALAACPPDGSVVVSECKISGATILSYENGESWSYHALVDCVNGPVIINLSQRIAKTGTGEGASRFVSQVIEARRLGFKRILATASGMAGHWMNGYYTWPRLGFDGRIPDGVWRKMPETFRGFAGPGRRVALLCEPSAGADWWKANGRAMNVWFDLSDGSLSMNILLGRFNNGQSN